MVAISKSSLMGGLFLFSFLSAASQIDSTALSEQYFKMGMEVFDFTHRKQATDLFIQATQMDPNNARAYFMAGQSIMLTVRKDQSLPYFKKAVKLDPSVDEDILYFMGQAYHQNEKFDSAILYYDRYNRILARSLRLDKSNKINEVNRKIFECRNAKSFIANPVDVSITNLSTAINSEYPDYAPTINGDETLMVFTSRRPEGNLNANIAVDHEYYEDIFYTTSVNGEWQPAKNMRGPLNTNYHNSSVTLSADGKEIILYHDSNGGDLLFTKQDDTGKWSAPKLMEGINSEYLENSATLNKEGNRIFFTSDRPGGYGGTDIYSADLGRGDRWINVQNLGPEINTEMDEDGVFLSYSGRHLYFSSNGHAGMGDMDIYRSALDTITGLWTKPINMGYPINSVENDIYFVLNANERDAYISSVRGENIGEQDIYKISMDNWEPVDMKQPDYAEVFAELPGKGQGSSPIEISESVAVLEADVNLLVLDALNKGPLNAQVTLVDTKNDRHPISKGETGYYHAKLKGNPNIPSAYRLEVSAIGYSAQHTSIYLGGFSSPLQITDTLYLGKLAVNEPSLIDIYFGHDSDEPISFNGIKDFINMMERTPGMIVEIGGHTDGLGPDEYNQQLSQRRADAVKKYLMRLGIDEARIKSAGYGESKPVASNDTQEGRKLNRRTEFTILKQ